MKYPLTLCALLCAGAVAGYTAMTIRQRAPATETLVLCQDVIALTSSLALYSHDGQRRLGTVALQRGDKYRLCWAETEARHGQ